MSECMLWAGPVNPAGYGRWGSAMAHRRLYEILVGPIPKGLLVLHKCDTPLCFNPEHLFLGTHQDNTNDMLQKKRGNWNMGTHQLVKTHCPKGHEYTEKNTRFEWYKGKQRRHCISCDRERSHKRKVIS